jgi:uncharacterized membrane protein
MTALTPPAAREDLAPFHRRVPASMWAAVVIALLAIPVGITFESMTTINGEQTQCSFLDVGALAAALAVVALVGRAFLANGSNRRVAPRYYVSPAVLVAFAVPLLALAAYHVVSGLGIVGGPCT